jgi:type IV pilus assembly protein PilA
MSQKNQSGFTLIELMIVVAIISILATLALPKFASFQAKAIDTQSVLVLKNLIQSAEVSLLEDTRSLGGCHKDGASDTCEDFLGPFGYSPAPEEKEIFIAGSFLGGGGGSVTYALGVASGKSRTVFTYNSGQAERGLETWKDECSESGCEWDDVDELVN